MRLLHHCMNIYDGKIPLGTPIGGACFYISKAAGSAGVKPQNGGNFCNSWVAHSTQCHWHVLVSQKPFACTACVSMSIHMSVQCLPTCLYAPCLPQCLPTAHRHHEANTTERTLKPPILRTGLVCASSTNDQDVIPSCSPLFPVYLHMRVHRVCIPKFCVTGVYPKKTKCVSATNRMHTRRNSGAVRVGGGIVVPATWLYCPQAALLQVREPQRSLPFAAATCRSPPSSTHC